MEQKSKPTINDEKLQMALNKIRKAVQGEREDELFYDYLISQASTNDEKQIISSIRDDERKHNRMFRMIYEDFTDEELPAGEEVAFEEPASYLDGIKRALFGELAAVERYKSIRRMLPEPYKEILFDIITDELKHASKYNYLFTLNSTMNNYSMNENLMRQDVTNTNNNTSAAQNVASTDTSKFTPDDWVKYITPLVNRALAESKEGINPEHLYQEFILSGVLVGLGKKPQDAIEQVEEWEKTGTSKLLAMSKMSRYFE
ncbi:ferritin-like domain-containing protein [Clostridium sp.]|uniref:ferritin-like domain-containing protein n=1 Tax=Clostridium sp. TaxID=1506 RepID=UPI002631454B|nr:ferritin-like domain-containing protein [Clostridium sp.]